MNKASALPYTFNKNVFFDEERQPSKVETILRRILARFGRDADARIVITEQTVEYPLLFQELDRNATTVLDFGCVEGVLPLQLCALGYQVTGLDFRPYPLHHPNFSFIQGDILVWTPPENQFDAVISISTIEHVGLGGYGDPAQNQGDQIAVEKLWRACRPGGKLYLSVPAGRPCTQRNLRVYDAARLADLVPHITSVRYFAKPGRYGSWQETSAEDIAQLTYDDYYATSPVQAVAFVVGEKQA